MNSEEEKSQLNLDIGLRIKDLRDNLRLSREEFSETIGITPQFLYEIETGKKGISVHTLNKICEKFNVSSDYLVLGRIKHEGLPTNTVALLKSIVDNELIELLNNIIIDFAEVQNKRIDKE